MMANPQARLVVARLLMGGGPHVAAMARNDFEASSKVRLARRRLWPVV